MLRGSWRADAGAQLYLLALDEARRDRPTGAARDALRICEALRGRGNAGGGACRERGALRARPERQPEPSWRKRVERGGGAGSVRELQSHGQRAAREESPGEYFHKIDAARFGLWPGSVRIADA